MVHSSCKLNFHSFEKQGAPILVLFPVQVMVDDSENGHLRERYPFGDSIHANREQR